MPRASCHPPGVEGGGARTPIHKRNSPHSVTKYYEGGEKEKVRSTGVRKGGKVGKRKKFPRKQCNALEKRKKNIAHRKNLTGLEEFIYTAVEG